MIEHTILTIFIAKILKHQPATADTNILILKPVNRLVNRLLMVELIIGAHDQLF